MAETSPGDVKATDRLHKYWVHGEGAAKIRWGEPGDYDRCVLHLGKFLADPHGYCAKAHHDALGIWPATHAAMEKHAGRADMATTMQEARQVTDKQPASRAEFMRLYPTGAGSDGTRAEASSSRLSLGGPRGLPPPSSDGWPSAS